MNPGGLSTQNDFQFPVATVSTAVTPWSAGCATDGGCPGRPRLSLAGADACPSQRWGVLLFASTAIPISCVAGRRVCGSGLAVLVSVAQEAVGRTNAEDRHRDDHHFVTQFATWLHHPTQWTAASWASQEGNARAWCIELRRHPPHPRPVFQCRCDVPGRRTTWAAGSSAIGPISAAVSPRNADQDAVTELGSATQTGAGGLRGRPPVRSQEER